MRPDDLFEEIQAAAARIAGAVVQTPCPHSTPLSEAAGMRVYCKMENLQRTGSFKERGARNALLRLRAEQQSRGVIAASAGNHALALAYHGQLLGIPVAVVMPRHAPLIKVANCRRFGADVVLEGATLAEAKSRADALAAERGFTYINGFDDPEIIAGQGTLGLEILAQVPEIDAIIVPIGGGGLIAGVATAVKKLRPSIRVIGVEPERATCFSSALKAGTPVEVQLQPTLADGLSVPRAGFRALEIARPLIDRIIQVDEHAIALAILRLIELEKAVVEGAGAAPLAALLGAAAADLRGKNVVIPLTGGNIDTSTLGRILERGLVSDGRLCRLTATISDRPGGLARFAAVIAEERGSIVEVNHNRAFASDDISTVMVDCTIETRDQAHIRAIEERLRAEGFLRG